MTYPTQELSENLQWLYARQQVGIKLGLEQTHQLLAAAGLKRDQMPPVIHVAGTNGKGSTCAFLFSLLSVGADLRTGLFTSPHLVRFEERIRDQDGMIGTEELDGLLGELRSVVETSVPGATFFEIALVLALMWFQQRDVEWVILETGLGGRLDATNFCEPEATIITRIGMDHQEMLGDTLAKIAFEKAGIIKPGVPVITGPQRAEALSVLRTQAIRQKSPIIEVTEPIAWRDLGLLGEHQGWNAALAVRTLDTLGLGIPADRRADALAQASWPGRFERVGGFILDGAHNEDGADALVETWRALYGQQKTAMIFGALENKPVREMIRILRSIVSHWHLPAIASPRALSPEKLSRVIREETSCAEDSIVTYPSVPEALEKWTPATDQAAGVVPILIAGSLYLVGECRSQLVAGAGLFESSSQ
jgi:dihydrofolate synthase/folylpolyglutamate synthase